MKLTVMTYMYATIAEKLNNVDYKSVLLKVISKRNFGAIKFD